MVYEINNSNVSTTLNNEEEKKWGIDNIYGSEFTVDSLIGVLQVIDIFKRKYPNDDIIAKFEDIVRDELCNLFGGSIYNNE